MTLSDLFLEYVDYANLTSEFFCDLLKTICPFLVIFINFLTVFIDIYFLVLFSIILIVWVLLLHIFLFDENFHPLSFAIMTACPKIHMDLLFFEFLGDTFFHFVFHNIS